MRWLTVVVLTMVAGCLRVEGEVPEACIRQENMVFDPSEFVDRDLIGSSGLELPGAVSSVTDQWLPNQTVLQSELEGFDRELAIEESFVFDDTEELDFLTYEGVQAEMRFTHMNITLAEESGDSFDFIHSFAVQVRPLDKASGLSEVELIRCTDGSCDFQSNEIHQASLTDTNIVPYLQQGSLEFNLQFEGTLPEAGWAADVEACLTATMNAQAF